MIMSQYFLVMSPPCKAATVTQPTATTGFTATETGTQTGTRRCRVNWEHLARATAHPLRISILEILGMDGGRTLSPSDLSHELQIPLSNTNYHVTELAKAGLIELVRQRQVRGATEHFYRIPTPGRSIAEAPKSGVSATT